MNATQQRGNEAEQFESKRVNPKEVVIPPKRSSAYPFRVGIAVFLLFINLVVAAIYLHIFNP